METDTITMEISPDNPQERPPIQGTASSIEYVVAPVQNEAVNTALSTKSDTEPLVTCQTDNCNLNIPLSRYDKHVALNHLKKPKHAGGRPCEFCDHKEEILRKTQEYIDSGRGDRPRMLFLIELALRLGKHRETIMNWAHAKREDKSLEHPEFLDMVKSVEQMQELRLQQRILGRYNPTGAIFLLKTKHGYIETDKRILAGNEANGPLQIEFVSERKLNE